MIQHANMNVWAFEKDMPLKLLLLGLVHRYGKNTLALNTREQRFQAVNLCRLSEPSISTPLVSNLRIEFYEQQRPGIDTVG